MEHFILNYTWFVLNYIFRFFGINPLGKDEFGDLKPTSFCHYWFRFFCTHMLLLSGYIGSFIVMGFIESTPELFEEAWRQTIAKSTITAISCITFWFILYCLNFILVPKLRPFAKALVGLQEYFKQNSILDKSMITNQMKKFYWTMTPNFLLALLGNLFLIIGVTCQLKAKLNLSSLCISIHVSSAFLLLCMLYVPVWYFILVYKELTILLGVWCDCLRNQIAENTTLIKKVKVFIEVLDQMEEEFSSFLFWITSLSMSYAIVVGYASIVQLKDINNMGWERLSVALSFGAIAIWWESNHTRLFQNLYAAGISK